MVGLTGSNPVPPTTLLAWIPWNASPHLAAPPWPETGPGRSRRGQRSFLDPADLVAHPRRFLELEVAGVLVHLLFERLETGRQLDRVERRVVLRFVGHPACLAGRRAGRRGFVAGAFHDVHYRA